MVDDTHWEKVRAKVKKKLEDARKKRSKYGGG
jgi:hypothetical protein